MLDEYCLHEWDKDDSCLRVAEFKEVAGGPLASEDRPLGKEARKDRNVKVGGLIVIRVRLVHIHMLDDVQVYHDFHDKPKFLHPLLALDHSYPQYGNLRVLSYYPTDQNRHR